MIGDSKLREIVFESREAKTLPPIPALAVVFSYCQEQVTQENAMAKKLVHCVEGL
jgi:hypothetical protein